MKCIRFVISDQNGLIHQSTSEYPYGGIPEVNGLTSIKDLVFHEVIYIHVKHNEETGETRALIVAPYELGSLLNVSSEEYREHLWTLINNNI